MGDMSHRDLIVVRDDGTLIKNDPQQYTLPGRGGEEALAREVAECVAEEEERAARRARR